MRDALKLFSLYVSFDMVYIKAVLGCAEEKMFHFLSVFSPPLFFFFFFEANQGHHISLEISLYSNMYLTIIGSEGQ